MVDVELKHVQLYIIVTLFFCMAIVWEMVLTSLGALRPKSNTANAFSKEKEINPILPDWKTIFKNIDSEF